MRNPFIFAAAASLLCCSAFAGSEPPAWTPPKTTVAKELVEVGQFLLKHGMADPRGGKFCIAKVKTSSRWPASAYSYDFIGWVKESKGGKVIVDLTGSQFPVDTIVKEISVAEAVDRALEINKNGIGYGSSHSSLLGGFPESIKGEDRVFARMLFDEATILLLINGDVKDAERLFSKRVHSEYTKGKAELLPGLDKDARYQILNHYLEKTWVEAVDQHIYGSDGRAAELSKVLVDNLDAYRQYALTLKPLRSFIVNPQTNETAVFPYLSPASDLLSDSLRRVKEGSKTVNLASLDRLDQQERISRLIDLLDEVKEQQKMQPGDVNLTDDPIVQALIKEGAAAGDALLDCMEKDTRLTRSVSYHRSFFPSRILKTVKNAAFAAFCGIAQVDAYSSNKRSEPPVAELREFWAKWKNLSPAERWYDVLKNDKASHQQWAAAADWLVEPKDVVHRGGGWVVLPKMKNNKPEYPEKFNDLPADKKAILPDLLERRARQIEDENKDKSSSRLNEHDRALRLALAANCVDQNNRLQLLKDLIKIALDERTHYPEYIGEITGERLSAAYSALISANSPQAVQDYLSWLMGCKQEFFFKPSLFKPLELLPPDQGDKAVHDLLTSESSVYNVKSNIDQHGPFLVESLLSSPLLVFPSFRSMYLDLMNDKSPIGTININGPTITVTVKGKPGWEFGTRTIGEADISDAAKAVYRSCDFYAKSLSYCKGAPSFEIYWSESRKDAAIKELSLYLVNHWKDIVSDLREKHRF